MNETNVTLDMITALQKELGTMKGTIDQSKGRLVSVQEAETKAIAGLAELGVTPETAPAKIAELEASKTEKYALANSKMDEIKTALKMEG